MLARPSLSLSSLIAGLDEPRRWALEAVRTLAVESGLSVYLVGGPVRDAMLGAPVLDLDFSVEGDAIQFARSFSAAVGGVMTTHARFGTATVVARQVRIDLVTARSEAYSRPGQLPDVVRGSIDEDLARRDFSVNALALPLTAQDSEPVDLHGATKDLESRSIRVLHDQSFIDDPTRLLRAVRYEQRFGFQIEELTLASMNSAVAAGCMGTVSADRWRHELERIFGEQHPGPPLMRAAELGLMAGLHPALANAEGLRKLLSAPQEELGAEDWLAALFAPLTAREAESLIERLRLTGRMAEVARDTIVAKDMQTSILQEGTRPSALFRVLAPLEPAAVSAWAKLTDDPSVAVRLRRYLEEMRFVRPTLSGDALLAMGVPQGPRVGEILSSLRDAHLDGDLSSDDEELALVSTLLAESKINVVK